MKTKKLHMKTSFGLAIFATLLNVKLNILPSIDLLVVMFMVVLLDFCTGIIKAVILKKARTSEGYRKTVVKLMQYGGATVVGVLLKYLALKQSDMANLMQYIDYFTNGLVIFIIFIETTSILENIYAVDQNTVFSKYFVGPLLKILTFQIKNNPISKMEAANTPQVNS